MRVLGHMVTRNEADRYLDLSLRSLRLVCDDIAVFDDASTDETVQFFLDAGVHVESRDDDEVSFAQHEGQFRTLAWRWMEQTLEPEPGDWILVLDADEVIVSNDGDVRAAVHTAIDEGLTQGFDVLDVRIHELWELHPPAERTDGYWGAIHRGSVRRWEPGLSLPDRPMGSGSVPPHRARRTHTVTQFRIAHLGYVRGADRVEKHARYSTRPGHSREHVASILKPPTLAPIEGIIG